MSRANIVGSPSTLPLASGDRADAGAWAVCCRQADASALGAFRQLPQLEICQQPDALWLRGESLTPPLEQQLRGLSGAARYHVLADGQLVAAGSRVPRGYLPQGPWLALHEWMTAELPPAALAGQLAGRISLKLVRSTGMENANVLLTSFAHWAAYATQAPEVRLSRLRFALAKDGRTLIRGTPLPPIPGQRAVAYEGIVLPVGYFWSPAIDAAMVRQVLGLEGDDLALGRLDGSWEHIQASRFVAATRSAVRASAGQQSRRS